jgi:predicted aldo/keto reductase-like oxidoreductase
MADAFIASGLNYFDTAHGYLGGKSELGQLSGLWVHLVETDQIRGMTICACESDACLHSEVRTDVAFFIS